MGSSLDYGLTVNMVIDGKVWSSKIQDCLSVPTHKKVIESVDLWVRRLD